MENEFLIPLAGERSCAARRIGGRGKDLAVIMPGLGYSCEKPLLAGISQMFQAQGVDVIEVAFAYQSNNELAGLTQEQGNSVIEADGRAILDHILALPGFQSLTLVGKSLSTGCLAGMVDAELPPNTRFVWLTPVLAGTPLLGKMQSCRWPSFSLIGSRDQSVEISRSVVYRCIKGLTHLEVAGMDHGWQHDDGEEATLRGLQQALSGLSDWLDHSASPA